MGDVHYRMVPVVDQSKAALSPGSRRGLLNSRDKDVWGKLDADFDLEASQKTHRSSREMTDVVALAHVQDSSRLLVDEEETFSGIVDMLRFYARRIIEHPRFEAAVLTLVVANAISLAITSNNRTVDVALEYFGNFCAIMFFLEASFKIFGQGPREFFFSDAWGWNMLDFFIAIEGMAMFIMEIFAGWEGSSLGVMRVFRTLRPLRTLSHFPDLRVLATALFLSVDGVIKSLVIWAFAILLSSLMCMAVFKSSFEYACSYNPLYDEGFDYLPCNPDADTYSGGACHLDVNWAPILTCSGNATCDRITGDAQRFPNFRSFDVAMSTMLRVQTMEDWSTATWWMQSTEGPMVYFFMVAIIFIGPLTAGNVFAAALLQNFADALILEQEHERHEQEKRGEAADVERRLKKFMITTEKKQITQWVCFSKTMIKRFPILDADNHFNGWGDEKLRTMCLDDMSTLNCAMMVVILANVTLLSLNSYRPGYHWDETFAAVEVTFTSIFIGELAFKLAVCGLGQFLSFGHDVANMVDMIIVLTSMLELAAGYLMEAEGLSSTRALKLLRFLRAVRLARVFRTWSAFQNVMRMLTITLSRVGSTLVLWGLLAFIFSIIGMELYGDYGVQDRISYRSFNLAVVPTLLVMSGEDWGDVLDVLVGWDGARSVLYVLSLVIFSKYILMNLVLAAILEDAFRGVNGLIVNQNTRVMLVRNLMRQNLRFAFHRWHHVTFQMHIRATMVAFSQRWQRRAFDIWFHETATKSKPGGTVRKLWKARILHKAAALHVQHTRVQHSRRFLVWRKLHVAEKSEAALRRIQREAALKQKEWFAAEPLLIEKILRSKRLTLGRTMGSRLMVRRSPGLRPGFRPEGTCSIASVSCLTELVGYKWIKQLNRKHCHLQAVKKLSARIGLVKRVCLRILHSWRYRHLVTAVILINVWTSNASSLHTDANGCLVRYWDWRGTLDLTTHVLLLADQIVDALAYPGQALPWRYLDGLMSLATFLVLALSGPCWLSESWATLFGCVRCLRPLVLASRFSTLQTTASALGRSFAEMSGTLMLILIIMLCYAVVGLQLFTGQFWSCSADDYPSNLQRDAGKVDPNTDDVNTTYTVDPCSPTYGAGRGWERADEDFDNLLRSFLTVFTFTLGGWKQPFLDALSGTEADYEPREYTEKSDGLAMCLAFVYFIVGYFVFSMFLNNLFLGVTHEAFTVNMHKMHYGLILSKEFRLWTEFEQEIPYTCRPHRHPESHGFWLVAQLHRGRRSRSCHFFLKAVFLQNLLLTAAMNHDQSKTLTYVLNWSNLVVTATLGVLVLEKILGVSWKFFFHRDLMWDIFVLGLSLWETIWAAGRGFHHDTGCYAHRLLKAARMLVLIRLVPLFVGKGIDVYWRGLMGSSVKIATVACLMLLMVLSFAGAGVLLFGPNSQDKVIFDYVYQYANFRTLPKAMEQMFFMATGQQIYTQFDLLTSEIMPRRQAWIVYVFVLTWCTLTNFFFVNMFVLMICEVYELLGDKKRRLAMGNFEAFNDVWSEYDRHCEGLIEPDQLKHFLTELPPPLGAKGRPEALAYTLCLALQRTPDFDCSYHSVLSHLISLKIYRADSVVNTDLHEVVRAVSVMCRFATSSKEAVAAAAGKGSSTSTPSFPPRPSSKARSGGQARPTSGPTAETKASEPADGQTPHASASATTKPKAKETELANLGTIAARTLPSPRVQDEDGSTVGELMVKLGLGFFRHALGKQVPLTDPASKILALARDEQAWQDALGKTKLQPNEARIIRDALLEHLSES